MTDELSTEAIKWGYRLFLGREPESEAAIERARSYGSIEIFRDALLRSEEFGQRNQQSSGPVPLNAPPIDVDWKADPVETEVLLSHVKETWTRLGAVSPHWSVLSSDQFMPERIPDTEDQFFGSGYEDVEDLVAILVRNKIEPSRIHHAFEFGCGIARVTPYLAQQFRRVTACDVSSAHLQIARQVIARSDVNNVALTLATADDFGITEPCDLWFCRLVLQHNPPPIMAQILRRAFSCLAFNGIAVFQVPTYSRGYQFNTAGYLGSLTSSGQIEMHVLPQHAVFRIASISGCQVLEVREDTATGVPGWLSNTFVIIKSHRD